MFYARARHPCSYARCCCPVLLELSRNCDLDCVSRVMARTKAKAVEKASAAELPKKVRKEWLKGNKKELKENKKKERGKYAKGRRGQTAEEGDLI